MPRTLKNEQINNEAYGKLSHELSYWSESSRCNGQDALIFDSIYTHHSSELIVSLQQQARKSAA